MQKINKQWRGKNKTTDVLSFPQHTVPELINIAKYKPAEWLLGDIVISVDTAKQQAKLHQISLEQEIYRLTAHGFLHLLGYDHELGEKEAKRMFRLERILLTR